MKKIVLVTGKDKDCRSFIELLNDLFPETEIEVVLKERKDDFSSEGAQYIPAQNTPEFPS